MERRRVSYVPEYDRAIGGWATNYIHKHLWRVSDLYEFEDLQQEAYMVFLKIKRKYPEVNNRRHFMALFKRALTNRITDLAKRSHRSFTTSLTTYETTDDESPSLLDVTGEWNNNGYLIVLLTQAPADIIDLLVALSSSDKPAVHNNKLGYNIQYNVMHSYLYEIEEELDGQDRTRDLQELQYSEAAE